MINSGIFAGKTVFVTGGSRGIGKAIALKLARDGANIVISAKTVDPHPKLEGTIYTAAKEVESVGGKCLPIQCDIRDDNSVSKAIDETVKQFGGIDILVNNASAIQLTGTEKTDMKKYDLMNSVNARGTYLTSKLAVPHLKKAANGHILNLSPPLEMKEMWFKNHVAYSMAKYGMSLCVLGMAGEFRGQIAVNALWPKTAIYTAAMKMLGGGDQIADSCRKPDILADAAYWVLSQDKNKYTGNFAIDEEVLLNAGITNLDDYACKPGAKLMLDFFIPEKYLAEDAAQSNNEEKSGASGIAKIFDLIAANMNDQLKNELNAILLFNVSGKMYFLEAKSDRPFNIHETEPGKPDVTLQTDENTFIEMAKGNVKAANAFMAGKLKIKGNIAVAMKAEKLFAKLKAKL